MDKKISVISDLDGKKIVVISDIRFKRKEEYQLGRSRAVFKRIHRRLL